MTTVGEKEILEIENLKEKLSKVFHDTQIDMKRFYEALRLAFYTVVGAGRTFAVAKTLQILGSSRV